MFSRRKHRTAHTTAYTGVSPNPQSVHAPSHNAMAAALTIGQSIKDSAATPGSVPRLASFQVQPQRTIPRLRSVRQQPAARTVPRLPSINQGRRMDHYKQPASPDSRRSSFQNPGHDSFASFNDSFNDQAVSDLKLSDPANAPVKMVKKYIPTPSGIKVVEVPEANFAKEVARSNSLRTGPNMYRSGSMNSLSSANKRRIPRALSLTSPPQPQQRPSVMLPLGPTRAGMSAMPEVDEVPDALADAKEHQMRLQALQKQIDNEKRMARELDEMKREVARLKAERLAKEKSFSEPDAPAAAVAPAASAVPLVPVDSEEEEEDVPIVEPPFAVDELAQKELRESGSPIMRPSLGHVNDSLERGSDRSSDYSDTIPDASIDVSAVVVDELEQQKLPSPEANDKKFESLDPASGTEPHVIGLYATSADHADEGKFVDVPDLPEPTLDTSTLKPQFDPSPEYIDSDDSKNVADVLHLPPTMNNVSSSNSLVRSGGTLESPHKSALKPKKSAIKNSNSFYNSASAPRGQNPAREAYLSLTTAENTRLNSKLSSSQLSDALAVNGFDSHHYPTAGNAAPRLQATRKPPQAQQGHQPGAIAHKTLRPNSESFSHGQLQAPSNGGAGGMSNRSLRDRHSYVAPIAPHPALQPNYQSPSKQRAAELYARANSRPLSQFKPLAKKKDSEANGKPHRTTLRDIPHSQPVQQPAVAAVEPEHQRDLSSMEADSPSRPGFTSRLADSDDEDIPQATAPAASVPPAVTAILPGESTGTHTLRQPKEEPKKSKDKKKFGKLRKLFGRNHDQR